jgi:hypothetical protein
MDFERVAHGCSYSGPEAAQIFHGFGRQYDREGHSRPDLPM